ncbi:SHOCT domain-containing protein [Agromyces sp. H3Y2-19a]|uniref:SHOCT domain-containing protein n=1 Tax=Agromyces chromiiresistens TaxID=3030835 RepID=UPI0023B94D68|nr:SHOCT domain-containing protein [Agromyces chromiiresistens]MDF0513313.1 SHOCT domain-containing protein [Agromyces chromiiresistens]
MMWGYGYGAWWMWIPAVLIPLLIVAGIVVAIVFSVRETRTSSHPSAGWGHAEFDSARPILEDRLAKGEITPDQFRELLETLDVSRRRS